MPRKNSGSTENSNELVQGTSEQKSPKPKCAVDGNVEMSSPRFLGRLELLLRMLVHGWFLEEAVWPGEDAVAGTGHRIWVLAARRESKHARNLPRRIFTGGFVKPPNSDGLWELPHQQVQQQRAAPSCKPGAAPVGGGKVAACFWARDLRCPPPPPADSPVPRARGVPGVPEERGSSSMAENLFTC